jgi:acylphosphatase
VTAPDATAPPVRRLVVQGKVQGVGFRWFVRERARRLGVAGWVRNESDGTVQIVVGGPGSLVTRFIGEVKIGPPNAVIEEIRDVGLEDDVTDNSSVTPRAVPTLPYPFEIRR